ncbi:hypothetical protein HK104_009297 [Borealophlyctis nickersoniae]|nr:hypothetical protein HK104_009297 [Borealophlyctis nickersoniae]
MRPLASISLAIGSLAILISGIVCYFQIKACLVHGPRSRLLYLLAGCAVCVCGSLVFHLPLTLFDVDFSRAETATERIALAAYVVDMIFSYGAGKVPLCSKSSPTNTNHKSYYTGYTYGLILLDRFAIFHNLLRYPPYLIPLLFRVLSIIYPIGFLSDIIVVWHQDLTILFNVLSLSAYLYVILLDLVMAPVMVRKVFEILRDLEGASTMDVTGRDEQQESAGQEGGMMCASSRGLCSATVERNDAAVGGEKVSLSVDAGWRFVTLFVGAMIFDVGGFVLYGLMIVFPDDEKAIWLLMGTCVAFHATTGLLFLKQLKTTIHQTTSSEKLSTKPTSHSSNKSGAARGMSAETSASVT